MTPKIIHFLWLNFNEKTDGILDETLIFFKNRIEYLHPKSKGWNINFISNWNDCLNSIDSEEWLKDLLNNDFVGPAHKSDALRYYYLYKMGGIWIDLSTFLVSPLDDLITQNADGFTCYYMPSNICASWLIKISSDIFENVPMKTYINNIVPLQADIINIKHKKFDFITENYFLIFSKENEICNNVLEQLKSFWSTAIPKIKSKEDYCYELNMLLYDLFKKVYKITNRGLPYLDLLDKTNIKDTVKNIILKEYFDCAYFFNYLQLYLAVQNYSKSNSGKLTTIPNSKKKNDTIKLEKLSSFSRELCLNNSCNNKVIKFSDKNKNIYLLSASYNRLSKWSDDRNKRITWENTLAGDILENNDNPDTVLEKLREIEVYQLKYSSYTRDKSDSIAKLKTIFKMNNDINGGTKKKISQNKSKRRKNKISKKTANKNTRKYNKKNKSLRKNKGKI